MSNALELALEALEANYVDDEGFTVFDFQKRNEAIAALKEAIKAQGEPVGEVNKTQLNQIGWLTEIPPDGTKLYTQAPTIPAPSAEVMSELDNVHELIAKISGSALLAGENCPDRDKAALYGIACEALVAVGYARTLLSAAQTIPEHKGMT